MEISLKENIIIPKELMTPKYAGLSPRAKLLFSLLYTMYFYRVKGIYVIDDGTFEALWITGEVKDWLCRELGGIKIRTLYKDLEELKKYGLVYSRQIKEGFREKDDTYIYLSEPE